jgi:hypothetical protein
MSHTPGPWKVSRRFDVYQDTQTPGVGGTFVASTKGQWPLPESINQVCEADAKLIAAAPELLKALQDILIFDSALSQENARSAIRKAIGESE